MQMSHFSCSLRLLDPTVCTDLVSVYINKAINAQLYLCTFHCQMCEELEVKLGCWYLCKLNAVMHNKNSTVLQEKIELLM